MCYIQGKCVVSKCSCLSCFPTVESVLQCIDTHTFCLPVCLSCVLQSIYPNASSNHDGFSPIDISIDLCGIPSRPLSSVLFTYSLYYPKQTVAMKPMASVRPACILPCECCGGRVLGECEVCRISMVLAIFMTNVADITQWVYCVVD